LAHGQAPGGSAIYGAALQDAKPGLAPRGTAGGKRQRLAPR
jgi:hypothetical protein